MMAVPAAIFFGCIAVVVATTAAAEEYRHTGGGLSSNVMRTIISKLPPITPPTTGVRDGGKLMRTVHLQGHYMGDVPLVLPSYTRLVLNGTMSALPYTLRWTKDSAGAPNQTASLVTVKDAEMVSGNRSCTQHLASAQHETICSDVLLYTYSTLC